MIRIVLAALAGLWLFAADPVARLAADQAAAEEMSHAW
jgi:hypothetical protein